jgi:hypothetical protein
LEIPAIDDTNSSIGNLSMATLAKHWKPQSWDKNLHAQTLEIPPPET